jgi:hypothetical protein
MHSSREDWVLGIARLISSTSTMFADYRSGPELELGVLLVEELDPHDVGRQEIRRALDPLKGAVQGAGGRFCKKGLPDTGNIFDEHVTFAKKRDKDQINGLLFPHDHFADVCNRNLSAVSLSRARSSAAGAYAGFTNKTSF